MSVFLKVLTTRSQPSTEYIESAPMTFYHGREIVFIVASVKDGGWYRCEAKLVLLTSVLRRPSL